MADLPENVALVYDRVNKWGGAENVLLSLHDIFPHAPLYTAVYDPRSAGWARVFPRVIPSFLQTFPLAKSHHEFYPWLTPLAFESLDFRQFECVISLTSAEAKGILTPPSTFHFCYCLTPTRYLWVYPSVPWPASPYLKAWDQLASRRPDAYAAISNTVKRRIRSFYGQDSTLVYPPVDIEKFSRSNAKFQTPNDKYFLWVGRLVYHKKPDLIIQIFNELQLPLIVVGTGRMYSRLRQQAGPNIKFTGFVPDAQLSSLYHHAKALVSVHEEDFGLVYVEAQAAGLPVVGLDVGGVSEIVVHHQTGYLARSLPELKQTLAGFDHLSFNFPLMASVANRFSRQRFRQEFVKVLSHQWKNYSRTYLS